MSFARIGRSTSRGRSWLGGGAGLLMLLQPASAWAGGTVALLPEGPWAEQLARREMAELRGGVDGLGFNIAFTGFIDDLGNVDGSVQLGDGLVEADPPDFSSANGEALVSTQIGDFQNFSGIMQLAVTPGDFNFVQNNLFVQINVVNGSTEQLPTLSDLVVP